MILNHKDEVMISGNLSSTFMAVTFEYGFHRPLVKVDVVDLTISQEIIFLDNKFIYRLQ